MARANVESIDRSSDCDVAFVVARRRARARKRGNAFPHTRVCRSFGHMAWHGMAWAVCRWCV